MADSEDRVHREIIEAARGYFTTYGYSRVSTDEIVRSIGRSKKTLYKHFETKEALLQAVLQRLNNDIEERLLTAIADTARSYLDRLHDILSQVAVHVASTGGVLFTDLRQKHAELWQQTHGDRNQALIDLLMRIIRQGIETGELRDDLCPTQVLTLFLSSVEGLASPGDIVANASAPEDLFATLVTLTIDGMRAR